MKKNPHHLRLNGYLLTRLEDIVAHDLRGDQVIYEGPVRPLCALAPNNVNTMACAALAAPDLGFDRTQCRLVANKELTGHVICVQIEGPGGFTIESTRFNPAFAGAVTGNATYASFLSSLLVAVDKCRADRTAGRGQVCIV
eukprot:CAMPEP_0185041660 /NCGR_PEP_ID=MMETSP1103-20130426/41270_1 /TAXON_ID=36769 /ORGANISM="Paraphysomonas bandaiensis, Strain Caron Lab Isolate" /LENGTH=140 /DNA_ID=CAMNT_0027581503 /DNA_START=65 /DNA_END=487 /DNA_ORIENTATION=-